MSTHSTPSHDASSGAAHVGAHPTPFARLVRLLSARAHGVGLGAHLRDRRRAGESRDAYRGAALVNTITFGMVLQPIVVLAFLVFLGLCFEGTMDLFQLWLVELIQRRVFVRVATDLAHRLPAVRLDAVDGTNRPELVNRFFDVLTVQKTAATPAPRRPRDCAADRHWAAPVGLLSPDSARV
jgi:putative ABC transport system ATP-binding protein